jgi:7-keto-8-aminopelargonate synthetase-like enzyme
MDSNVICPFYLWDTRYSQDSREKISDFYGTEDTILYAAAFDANGGFLSLYLRR